MSQPVDYAFLHGGGQGGWVWDETIAALDAQTGGGFGRALALDAPGCGRKRGRATDGIDNEAIAAELIADIEAAGLGDVVLVGHSQAGMVLPFMVEQRPSLFRRIVYVTCSAPPAGRTTLSMMGASLHGENPDEVGWPVDPKTHSVAERYPLMFCNDMDPAQTEAFLGKLGHDMWPALTYSASNWRYDHLDAVPASYVVCLRDGSLPVPWQETFATRLKAERRVRIDAGHQVMNTRPHALAEVLRLEALAG
ncbi:alpha/beta hydrolase [Phenylobacterium sp. LjRoot225]|uniref:alpha/beta fold hydrolase n=1 Tax=Phenylobacterium sp. LjRoot225 TaxID=3342285 RepID=UPI003ECC753A